MEKPATPKVTNNKLAIIVLEALKMAVSKLGKQVEESQNTTQITDINA